MRIRIIIADEDKDYASALADYFIHSPNRRFEVMTFSDISVFCKFLEPHISREQGRMKSAGEMKGQKDMEETKTGDVVDILLAGQPFFAIAESSAIAGKTVLLSENKPGFHEQKEGPPVIFKYQTGDRIASQVVNIYRKSAQDGGIVQDSHKKTHFIAVFSPTGGSGKTVIALACAMQSAGGGKPVFYLNLEDIPSTELFLEGTQEQDLSSVLLYLKEAPPDLGLKIERAKCSDLRHNIHYFKPPASSLELTEELGEEIRRLLFYLGSGGLYELVFLDMSPGLHRHNIILLEKCDEIFLVFTPDIVCGKKLASLMRDIALLERSKNLMLSKKIIPILNKYETGVMNEEDFAAFFSGAVGLKDRKIYKIPKISGLLIKQGERYRIDLNNAFGSAIYELPAGLFSRKEEWQKNQIKNECL